MDPLPAPPRLYAHRRADAAVLNTTLDRAAIEILYRYAPPGRRATGHFLARLLYEHEARVQARAENLYESISIYNRFYEHETRGQARAEGHTPGGGPA